MNPRRRARALVLALPLLVLAGCGSDDSSATPSDSTSATPSATASATTTSSPATTPSATPPTGLPSGMPTALPTDGPSFVAFITTAWGVTTDADKATACTEYSADPEAALSDLTTQLGSVTLSDSEVGQLRDFFDTEC